MARSGTPDAVRCAVLYPAVAEAARRLGAGAVGLVDLGSPPGVAVRLDRIGITYSDGRTLGDLAAPVQVSASVVGPQPVPARAVPEVAARVVVERDAVGSLPGAVAAVPADALPVVITTWALSRLAVSRRPLFLERLAEVAAGRPVAWVSVEGVGVAPSVPTLGDRPASGHSITGLVVPDGTGLRAAVLGRCWSRGRFLSWLAPQQR